MWAKIADRVNEDSKEIDEFLSEKGAKHCRDKINNLNKKYKKVKDQSRTTGKGSEEIKGFPEFVQLDEIWGTRDAVSPKNVLEAGTGLPAVQRLEESLDEAETQSAISSRPSTPSSSRSVSEDTRSRTENDGSKLQHDGNQEVQKDKKEKQSKIWRGWWGSLRICWAHKSSEATCAKQRGREKRTLRLFKGIWCAEPKPDTQLYQVVRRYT